MQIIFKADTGQKNQQILSSMMGEILLDIQSNQEDPKQVTSQKRQK